MALDTKRSQVVDIAAHEIGTSLDTVPISSGRRPDGPRWHCVWTLTAREHLALQTLTEQGWNAYLPLHLDRHEYTIVPLFRRYLFCQFDAMRDAWGPIRHSRGVVDLIRHDIGQPTPIPPGIVEDLIARTSPRRIVDDPGSAPFPNPNVRRAHWQNITALSADDRNALLFRLFGS
jgi:transcription antitermination factor NusG